MKSKHLQFFYALVDLCNNHNVLLDDNGSYKGIGIHDKEWYLSGYPFNDESNKFNRPNNVIGVEHSSTTDECTVFNMGIVE